MPSETGVWEICQLNREAQLQFQQNSGYFVSSRLSEYEGIGRVRSIDSKRIVIDTSETGTGTLEHEIRIESRNGPLPQPNVDELVNIEFVAKPASFVNFQQRLVLKDSASRLVLVHFDAFVLPGQTLTFSGEPGLQVSQAGKCQLDPREFMCFEAESFLELLFTVGDTREVVPIFSKRTLMRGAERFEVANLFSKNSERIRSSCNVADIAIGMQWSFSLRRL